MAKEFVLIKVNNGFAYATDSDREAAASWKIGQAIRLTPLNKAPDHLLIIKGTGPGLSL